MNKNRYNHLLGVVSNILKENENWFQKGQREFQSRTNDNFSSILNPKPLSDADKAQASQRAQDQFQLGTIEGRRQANISGKANVDVFTGKRKVHSYNNRFEIDRSKGSASEGELLDLDPTSSKNLDTRISDKRPWGRGLAQRLAFDKGTRDAFDAQMDSAKTAAITRRNEKRKELGMSELNPYSPEATGRRLSASTIDRGKLSDPVYRQEAIRQLNDTRTSDQRRQDREQEQTLDAVRQGGQAKETAISRFNQSISNLEAKSAERERKMKEMGLG